MAGNNVKSILRREFEANRKDRLNAQWKENNRKEAETRKRWRESGGELTNSELGKTLRGSMEPFRNDVYETRNAAQRRETRFSETSARHTDYRNDMRDLREEQAKKKNKK